MRRSRSSRFPACRQVCLSAIIPKIAKHESLSVRVSELSVYVRFESYVYTCASDIVSRGPWNMETSDISIVQGL
jgi:hypothetical protein